MPETAVGALQKTLPYITDWVAYRAWKAEIPGLQLAIFFDGKVQLNTAYGFADVENKVELTTEHLFRIASHSKTFTSVAMFQLIEQGKVRLDDTVGTFIPEFLSEKSPLADATIGELLSHGAGIIRDGIDADFWQCGRPYPDEAELLSMLLQEGVVIEAHTAFKYSNVGYSLAGLIVARVSGMSYNEYVTRNIVDRLKLENTGPEWDETRAGEYTTGYTGNHVSRKRKPVLPLDTRAFSPSTGFYGTAENLVRYFAAYFPGDETLLKDRTKRIQRGAVWNSDPTTPTDRFYGYGLVVEKFGEHEVVGHSGGFPGHITYSVFDPEQGLAVSVLTNASDKAAGEVCAGVVKLLDAALKRKSDLTLVNPLAATHDAEVRADIPTSRFEGRYAYAEGVMDIVALGERLVELPLSSADPTAALVDLTVVDESTLKFSAGSGFGNVGELVHFTFNDDGTVSRIRRGGESMWPVTDLGAEIAPHWDKN